MKITNELKIGIMITLVLAALAVLTFKAGSFDFSRDRYPIRIHFENVDGISTNTPVMLNGLEVGIVEEVRILETQEATIMELVAMIDQTAQLRTGAKAYVKSMGFLGEKYVGLMSGGGQGYLNPDAIIVGEDPADMDQLMADGQVIAKEIREITENLNERLKVNEEKIDNIIANLDITSSNAVEITDNVKERLEKNKEVIDDMLAHIRSSSINLDQFTYDLKLHPWKLLYRTKEERAASIRMLEEEKKIKP